MLAELRDEVRTVRFRVASREIKNHQLMGQLRKDIARIMTILKERQHEHGKK